MEQLKYAGLRIEDMEAEQTPTHAPQRTKPPTWNDALNAMSINEKAHWMIDGACRMHNDAARCAWDKPDEFEARYVERMSELLASPYDGGKAQEGAERWTHSSLTTKCDLRKIRNYI